MPHGLAAKHKTGKKAKRTHKGREKKCDLVVEGHGDDFIYYCQVVSCAGKCKLHVDAENKPSCKCFELF